jgi:putative SOS response-associated peptidase YedK
MARPGDAQRERSEQIVLLECEPTEAFEWFKVDRAVGNVRNQGPDLIEPIGQITRDDEKGNL